MNTFLLVLLLTVPFIGIALLLLGLNRWGRKRDPMGGSSKDLLSTTGTQYRDRSHQN